MLERAARRWEPAPTLGMRTCRCAATSWKDVRGAAPNGSRLSCGRLARQRKDVGRSPLPRQGHNTPLPLKRPPPASFKRLLGSTYTSRSPPTDHLTHLNAITTIRLV